MMMPLGLVFLIGMVVLLYVIVFVPLFIEAPVVDERGRPVVLVAAGSADEARRLVPSGVGGRYEPTAKTSA